MELKLGAGLVTELNVLSKPEKVVMIPRAISLGNDEVAFFIEVH